MATVEYVGVFLVKLGKLCPHKVGSQEAGKLVEEYTRLLCREYTNEPFRDPDCLAYVAKQSPFFPAYAELCARISAWLGMWRVRSAAPAQRSLPAPPKTDEELAAIHRSVEQAAAVLAAGEPPVPEQPTVRPRHLSPADLLVQYERLAGQGNAAAAMRAAQLRKQLGKEMS